MKRSRFSEEQILAVLKEGESGRTVAEICRGHGITDQTYYRWKRKYGGLELSELRRMKQLEEENSKLKRLVADLSLDNVVLKDLLSKKW